MNTDAENMYIIVSARAMNEDCAIIARAETKSAGQKMGRAGASFVVLPHMMAGETVATAILNPRLSKAMRSDSCPNSRLTLGEAIVQEDSSLVAKSMQELGGRLGDLVFVAIETADGNLIMQPPGGQTFNPGDVIICADTQGDIQEVSLAASSTALAI